MTTIDDRDSDGKMAERIAFRAETPGDAPLIARAHAGHWRAPAGLDLPPALLATLLDQQHRSQEHHIAAAHPGAERRMILVDGVAVGRLCLDRTTLPWRLVDLALVGEATGRGIGHAALSRILSEAASAGADIMLAVAPDNGRALALYRRAGFIPAGGDGTTHIQMLWRGSGAPK